MGNTSYSCILKIVGVIRATAPMSLIGINFCSRSHSEVLGGPTNNEVVQCVCSTLFYFTNIIFPKQILADAVLSATEKSCFIFSNFGGVFPITYFVIVTVISFCGKESRVM